MEQPSRAVQDLTISTIRLPLYFGVAKMQRVTYTLLSRASRERRRLTVLRQAASCQSCSTIS